MNENPSRRDFVGAVSASGATLTLSGASDAATPTRATSGIAADDFLPFVGQTFRVRSDEGSFNLTLTSVDHLAAGDRPRRFRHPFSLIFRGTRVPALSQQIRELSNLQFGRFETFLVPIRQVGDETTFEAIYG